MKLVIWLIIAAIIGVLPTALWGYTIMTIEWWTIVIPLNVIGLYIMDQWRN